MTVGAVFQQEDEEVVATGAPPLRAPREWTTGMKRLPRWARQYLFLLIASDATAALVAATCTRFIRVGTERSSGVTVFDSSISYVGLGIAATFGWVIALALVGGYSASIVGLGSEEYRRTLTAGVRLIAVVAFVTYLADIPLARGVFVVYFPILVLATLVLRYVARKVLHGLRMRGEALHQVLVVGSPAGCDDLAAHFAAAPHEGFVVVGALHDGPDEREVRLGRAAHVPRLGTPDDVVEVLEGTDVDTIAVVGDGAFRQHTLRTVSWAIEGRGIDLLVAPGVLDVAGPRIVVRAVTGLPLLHVEEPELTGANRLVKDVGERLVAALALLVLAPVMLVVAAAVKLTSPGPALFVQERVGVGGRRFRMYKFRSMCHDAEDRRPDLVDSNESDGVLFKIRSDPRVTPVGRVIRRLSLDELPQLINVVRGDMSLVGPRPPLASEVERYGPEVHRRLLVKPGLTGLWQVSGRADLSWEESVRLDLYYVENWSLLLDLMILAKTARAVLSGHGAY